MESKVIKKDPIKTLLFAGIAIRVLAFIINLIVGGNNCDEVMTSLNAFSLADGLCDINGERLPLYFDTWAIGGQSPFATYLTALSVKILGKNLFAIRLPALVFSILGFIALYLFAKEVFKDEKYRAALVGLGSISPWMVFSGAYVMDCNYLGHLMIFALLFLVKAVKKDKTAFYVISSVFFGLCFYCYIASILIIPFMLIAIYITLLVKKKISVINLIITALTVTAVAVPFILWGLVITGLIPEFSLFGFSFSEMPNYARSADTALAGGGIIAIIASLFTNLLSAFMMLALNDMSAMALASNLFLYGFLLSGIIAAFGFIRLIFEFKNKKGELTFLSKLTAVGALSGIIAFCALVNKPHLGSLYRYGVLSYLLIFIEAIGIIEIFRLLKRRNFEKFLGVYLSLSLAVFGCVFAFAYVPQTRTATADTHIQETFGDRFFECMDFAKDNGFDRVVIVKSEANVMNPAAYARYYAYGKKDFLSIEDEIMSKNTQKDENGNYLVTADGAITYVYLDDLSELSQDFYIVQTNKADTVKYGADYGTKDFGYWTAIYRR